MKKNRFHILAQEWFDKADEDSGVAEHLLEERSFPAPICFHAQQAAEKYLKGFLTWHGKDIEDEFKIHNLEKLYEYAETIDKRIGDIARESCFILNRYYILARYPADMPEYSWKEVKEAVAAALVIKNIVIDLLRDS